jgi:hypothetical protein
LSAAEVPLPPAVVPPRVRVARAVLLVSLTSPQVSPALPFAPPLFLSLLSLPLTPLPALPLRPGLPRLCRLRSEGVAWSPLPLLPPLWLRPMRWL